MAATGTRAEARACDFGTFAMPEQFWRQHRRACGPVHEPLYRHIGRHRMNAPVRESRARRVPAIQRLGRPSQSLVEASRAT